jgi:hypothetical protein
LGTSFQVVWRRTNLINRFNIAPRRSATHRRRRPAAHRQLDPQCCRAMPTLDTGLALFQAPRYTAYSPHKYDRQADARRGLGIRMNRALIAIGVTSALLMVGQACADPGNRPQTPRRQLMDCMTRRMSADKTLSYNEAVKRCKQQMKTKDAAVISSNLAKPASTR